MGLVLILKYSRISFLRQALTVPLSPSLVSTLLMSTANRDISSAEACHELASLLPLYRSSKPFTYVSMSGNRLLDVDSNGSTVTKTIL